MISIIYPIDTSTKFLLQIFDSLLNKFGPELIHIHYIEPSEKSYDEGISFIESVNENSLLVFLGHGQNDLLFGAEAEGFEKRPFIKRNDFRIFKDKYLFSLSCYSNELLKSSLGNSGIINSIGFGILPTDMSEVENNKRLKELGITKATIQQFKDVLIELVTNAFSTMIINGLNFSQLSELLLLLLNRKISEVILSNKANPENRILADLLFHMKSEMSYL